MPDRNEAKTRQELIDPSLLKASWDVTNPDQVGLEIPVDGFDPQAWKRLEAKLKPLKEVGVTYNVNLPKGISDYVLYRPNGEIIAIVEAKRTSVAPKLAQILFVADREALVEQALTEGFQTHIPDEPRTRIFSHRIETSNRLYVATLQTLSNCFPRFSPGFFDLIIFDEVHRSIFNKWNEVLHYFDARMIGLTATPADFIDRSTFLAFECFDGVPTALYGYREAVAENYLVDYDLYQAQTRFQRKGIRGVDLSEEERNALIEQGLEPDDLDFSGTDLETKVSNTDTLRKQWEEIWQVCFKDQSGQLPGKTIVFAMTQEHALRLQAVFEEMYPQHPGLAQVITYKSEYKGQLIEKFKKESLPRVAISVDMLETGVNVPEAVNLVFMRPVQSQIKLEQMIGRGTRHHQACTQPAWLPNGRKESFLVIDFWENNFNKDPNQQPPQSLPVLVTIFNTRLRLLEQYLGDQRSDEAKRVVSNLRNQISHIPTDSYSVKQVWPKIQAAWEDSFWLYLTQDKLDFLRFQVGPLLRYVAGVDVQAATFTSKVERLKLQILTGKNPTATVQSIAEDVSRLPDFVLQDSQRQASTRLCLSPRLQKATPAELDRVIDDLAGQMKNRRDKPNSFVQLDLLDFVETQGYIILTECGQPIYLEKYRKLVDERVLNLVVDNPIFAAIEQGRSVSDEQLLALERTLRQTLGGQDLYLTETNIRKVYALKVDSLLAFVRHLFGLEGLPDYQDIVRRQFAEYIAQHSFNSDQVRFLRAVETVFLQRRRLDIADLYDPPLTQFGRDAVERLFSKPQIDEMLNFAASLSVD